MKLWIEIKVVAVTPDGKKWFVYVVNTEDMPRLDRVLYTTMPYVSFKSAKKAERAGIDWVRKHFRIGRE